jgi:putative intracellular protease/amidase
MPGGVINPDALRIQPKAVAFVKAFFNSDKPVASICHGTGEARGAHDLVAVAQNRSPECRSGMGG